MEKQILIKHLNEGIENKINDIINHLKILIPQNSNINICFSLFKKEYKCFEEIKQLESSFILETKQKQSLIKHEEYLELKMIVAFKDIKKILQIIEKYEVNILITYEKVRVILNDNDGDFIIINSKDKIYKKLKSLIYTK